MFRTVFSNIKLVAAMLIFAACSNVQQQQALQALPYYNTPDFAPIFLTKDQSAARQITHTIGDFALTNQHNQPITQKNIEGKIHVADFIFTSCGSICPIMTKQMKLLQKEFANNPNIVMLSYSVTPWIDSVQHLNNYTKANGIYANNWHFLTGSKADIYTLARKAYFAEEDLGFSKDSSQFLHTEHVLLVDKTKRIRGIYNGTLQLEMEQLIKDIKQLELE
ncbi:MAG: SCO family protein [Sediminibacterium sp.]|nr:MAG: hypothetical protein FD183_466 [Chitinophagaceae bacterium]MDP1844297.1 SCO family protein [Sediminibacterium sp.]TXT32112.1 MAG: hypothetical protein FD136_1374 [Chitinophagaceae bacterium]